MELAKLFGLVLAFCGGSALIPAAIAAFLIRRRRPRLGWSYLLLVIGPLLLLLAGTASDLFRAAAAPPGSGLRETPWGGMGGLVIGIPVLWGALTSVVGLAFLIGTVLVDRRRARLHS